MFIVKDNTYEDAREVTTVGMIAFDSAPVVAYASDEALENRQLLEQVGDYTLDSRKTYVVLEYSNQYFVKDIGCRIPSIIFCESPI